MVYEPSNMFDYRQGLVKHFVLHQSHIGVKSMKRVIIQSVNDLKKNP